MISVWYVELEGKRSLSNFNYDGNDWNIGAMNYREHIFTSPLPELLPPISRIRINTHVDDTWISSNFPYFMKNFTIRCSNLYEEIKSTIRTNLSLWELDLQPFKWCCFDLICPSHSARILSNYTRRSFWAHVSIAWVWETKVWYELLEQYQRKSVLKTVERLS